MSLLGVYMTVLAGRGVLLPLPEAALRAIDTVEITQGTESRSGLQAQFKAGRGTSLADIDDYPIMKQPGLKVGARFVLVLTMGLIPKVLFDGIVTQAQLNPGQGRGDGTLAVTAEDLRFKMDQQERDESYPGLPPAAIAALIMARYAEYGLVPTVIPPPTAEAPLPMDRVTTQSGTDLDFLESLAGQAGYVFTVIPGPFPGTSTGYFGPQPRIGVPQRALTVNMGADSNVAQIDFQYNAAEAHAVSGEVQDRTTNQSVPVRSAPASLRPPLATEPALANSDVAGSRIYRPSGAVSAAGAQAEAQAQSERSTDVLTAQGEVVSAKYGRVLEPRQLVGLRGAGRAHDGFWFVEEVKHVLKRGDYRQQFKLTREGTGTTTPVVIP
ncbi:Phage late control gene D protein (GPD) [Caballeronia calidae]|uniref:Phage late control gene D protein (GPD) n=1 Tax=Caballeronia calidae TaxID=1777139 RepID=A0A158ED86_9BURK|nr:hypothetical protein [Caballeronia calidae]SAL04851.1 Phage late control gene D protein (GPD) [Caballeronia calidae]